MRLYHCSPRENRASIGAEGIKPGPLGGVYLWPTFEFAVAYALNFDDVWEVDADGLELRPGGPYSTDFSEVWCPSAIDASRVRLLREAGRP
jgi:hypothetical protein